MILTLEITGPEAGKPGMVNRKVFQAQGGTIGRLPDNSWVLQDPYVSSRHAVIRYENGAFSIEDTSTNGVFINSTENRLKRGQRYPLQSGDRIFIDPYEIRSTITSMDEDEVPAAPRSDVFDVRSRPVPPGAPDPFALDDLFRQAPSPSSDIPLVPRDSGPAVDPMSRDEVDPLRALGYDDKRAPAPNIPKAENLGGDSVLTDHYAPPVLMPGDADLEPPSHGLQIPEGYNPLDSQVLPAPRPTPPSQKTGSVSARPSSRSQGDVQRPPARPRPPVPPGAPNSSAGDSDLAGVLAATGLHDVPVTPELARNFGHILRVVVEGVMDILQSRQRIKDELRIRVTTFKKADNNPLKFSANVEDALHNLLVKRNPAYLAPVEAFEDAFDDLRNHQMAMLAGMRVAFDAMLNEFDPGRLQEQFDRTLKKSASLVPGKLRYWDLYRERFHDMVKDPETSFRELFGDEFAKAYEQQLKKLKAPGRVGR